MANTPYLGRRKPALVQSDLTLSRQLILVQPYTNFCLSHAAFALPHQAACRSSVTLAMTLGLTETDQVWSL